MLHLISGLMNLRRAPIVFRPQNPVLPYCPHSLLHSSSISSGTHGYMQARNELRGDGLASRPVRHNSLGRLEITDAPSSYVSAVPCETMYTFESTPPPAAGPYGSLTNTASSSPLGEVTRICSADVEKTLLSGTARSSQPPRIASAETTQMTIKLRLFILV